MRPDTHLRELMEIKLQATERALQLQAQEYARRLDDLNHAAKTRQERDTLYITKEVYDVAHLVLLTKIEALEKLVYVGMGGAMVISIFLHFLR